MPMNDLDLVRGLQSLLVEKTQLESKLNTTLLQIREALAGLELLERNCPCGARPESLDTHPHVTNCLVEVILRKLRGKMKGKS